MKYVLLGITMSLAVIAGLVIMSTKQMPASDKFWIRAAAIFVAAMMLGMSAGIIVAPLPI